MIKYIFFFIFFFSTLTLLAGNKVIAISYFDNTTSNSKYNSLSKGIADMLITDLSKVRDVDIVEREKLEELIKEIKLGNSSYFDQSTAQKLGKGLGASSILTGAFYILDGNLRIDARLINVGSGKVIAADEVTGSTGDFFSLHKKLVKLLVESLKMDYNSKNQSLIDYDNKIELTAVVNYSNAIAFADNGLEENASDVLESTLKQYPEFLFAKTKLDKIKAFIAEREREREALMNIKLADFWSNYDPNSEASNNETMSIINNFVSNQSYNSILVFNNQLRKKGVQLNAPAYKGYEVTIGEYLSYYDCLSLLSLKKYSLLIEPSKQFLANYTTSNFFNGVKMNLNIAIKEIEKVEQGKKAISSALAFSETNEYVKFLNSLGYYGNSRFITQKNYEKFKKIYIQKVIKANRETLMQFDPSDRFDELTEFFELAEENLDKELMIQIKDLAIELCAGTDYENDAYELEEDISDYEEKREKHELKKAEAIENLNSGDIIKIAKSVQWLWLMRDKKEEEFILEHSLNYLDLKDSREDDRVYTTRLRAYENIVEAYDRLGEFEKMEDIVERYKADEFLLKNKDRDYDSQLRDFKKYLREGPRLFLEFQKNIINHDIKSNVLEGQATTYNSHHQYYDEISTRKELLEKFDLKVDKRELQSYLLIIAYSNVGMYKEMEVYINNFVKEHPKSVYTESVKMMLMYLPK
jgi:TolB-like protein